MLIIPVVVAFLYGKPPLGAQSQITLRFHPPIGKPYRFKTSMMMSMSQPDKRTPTNIQMDVEMVMKAVSRTGDDTTVESRVNSVNVIIPANSPLASIKASMEKQMTSKVMTTHFDGRYNMTGMVVPGLSQVFSNMQTLNFPAHPVKIGDTWSSKIDLGKLMGEAMAGKSADMKMNGKIPLKFKLERVVQNRGMSLAQIDLDMIGEMTMDFGGQKMKMHMDGSGSFLVEIATGMNVNMKLAALTITHVGTMEMKQHVHQTMELL